MELRSGQVVGAQPSASGAHEGLPPVGGLITAAEQTHHFADAGIVEKNKRRLSWIPYPAFIQLLRFDN